MDIWDTSKLTIFLVFFIPGFIAIQVYSLLVPSDQRDFSKQFPEAIGYSAINYAIFYWLILVTPANTIGRLIAEYAITFATPALLPFAFLKIRSWAPFKTINPFPKPWDYVFSQGNTRWVIVHLRNGPTIGGWFGKNSFASSYPSLEQLYLESVWELNPDGSFNREIARTRGVLINGSDIIQLEFKA